MAVAPFAIKEAIKVSITELGTSTPVISIPYLNESELSVEGENSFARVNGNDAVVFPGARKGQFSLKAEVADENFLGMSLGGTVTGNKIDVKGTMTNKAYKIEGTFNVVMHSDNSIVAKKLVIYKASPLPNSTINFSHDNVTAFDLTFDLMADAADNFITWDDASAE